MRIRGFKLKLILSYIFIIAVSVISVAFFLDRSLERRSIDDIKSSLTIQAGLIENQVRIEDVKKEDSNSLETFVKVLSPKSRCRITIITSQGKVLADSEKSEKEVSGMENHLNRPEVRAALSGETGANIRYSSTLKIGMLYVALPLKDKEGVIGVLRVALPLTSVQKVLHTIRKTVFIGLIFTLVLAFLFGSIVAGRVVEPINRMIEVSRKLSKGDFSCRVSLYSKDEIGELAETLNKMARDIEDKISQIKAQNQELAAIFNSMIEGIIVVDQDERVVSVNPAIEKVFGISGKESAGKMFLETIRNNDISEVINSVLKKGESASVEIALVYPVQRVFELSATPIFENTAVIGCVAVIHDITEMRRLETMRRDFVANVSHELKTPLTSIKGFVETLLEGALDDKEYARNFLNIIKEHTDRLDNLVNDLLSLSYLESKEISLKKNDVRIRALVGEAILGFKSQLNKRGIVAKDDLPPDLIVKADKDRIEQVLTNLIDNAIKFNKDKGSIKIYSQNTNDGIKFVIEDSGIGISEKDLSRIFERFYRTDKARSRELGGTGLGLSIVKHIIDLHGGAVGVESTEGLGSRFWFTLPR